jgi:hypothetical protein
VEDLKTSDNRRIVPGQLAVSTASGVAYINPSKADSNYKFKIVRYDPDSKKVTTFSGSGKSGFKDGVASVAQFSTSGESCWAENGCGDLVVDDATGNVFLSDTHNRRIRMIRPNGKMSTHAGSGGTCACRYDYCTTKCKDGASTAATFEAPGMTRQEHSV